MADLSHAPLADELAAIDRRVRKRAADDLIDRARQREIIRELLHPPVGDDGRPVRAPASWDDVQRVARVTRTTISRALRRQD
jgi:hypothetical protein